MSMCTWASLCILHEPQYDDMHDQEHLKLLQRKSKWVLGKVQQSVISLVGEVLAATSTDIRVWETGVLNISLVTSPPCTPQVSLWSHIERPTQVLHDAGELLIVLHGLHGLEIHQMPHWIRLAPCRRQYFACMLQRARTSCCCYRQCVSPSCWPPAASLQYRNRAFRQCCSSTVRNSRWSAPCRCSAMLLHRSTRSGRCDHCSMILWPPSLHRLDRASRQCRIIVHRRWSDSHVVLMLQRTRIHCHVYCHDIAELRCLSATEAALTISRKSLHWSTEVRLCQLLLWESHENLKNLASQVCQLLISKSPENLTNPSLSAIDQITENFGRSNLTLSQSKAGKEKQNRSRSYSFYATSLVSPQEWFSSESLWPRL